MVPSGRSRYYTKEVERRLRELLAKELEDYTWEDYRELERIAELVRREAEETRDRKYARELWKFLSRLEYVLALVEATLLVKDRALAR